MVKNISTTYHRFVIIFLFLCIYNNVNASTNIPKHIINFTKENEPNAKPIYELKWNKYKVYRLIYPTPLSAQLCSPTYILENTKEIKYANSGETWLLNIYITNHHNKENKKNIKKLEHRLNPNIDKILYQKDNTLPPKIPNILNNYVDEYLIKSQNKEIIYISDWENYHIYYVIWKSYKLICNRGSVLLFDGNCIRRPTQEEYKKIKPRITNKLYNEYSEYTLRT